jgi:hypothetical protein
MYRTTIFFFIDDVQFYEESFVYSQVQEIPIDGIKRPFPVFSEPTEKGSGD